MNNMPSPDELLRRYREANESYKRVLVFRTGIEQGFFAEHKCLIHAIIYCLQHHLRMKLYSHGANYAYAKGWTDYFQPFCEEVGGDFNMKYNVHAVQRLKILRREQKQLSLWGIVKWKVKYALYNRLWRLLALREYGTAALSTSDIPPYREQDYIRLPEIGIEGNYPEVFRALARMLWRFTPEAAAEMKAETERLSLPAHYAATQIRGGDKVTETDLYPAEMFVRLIEQNTPLRDVLLLTDDYAILERVRRDFPDIRWHSLCAPEEQGYYNNAFAHEASEAKHRQMIRFLAQIDAMLRADFFTGSVVMGPSLFVLEMMYPAGLPADCSAEQFPLASQISIPRRVAMAREYLSGRSIPSQYRRK